MVVMPDKKKADLQWLSSNNAATVDPTTPPNLPNINEMHTAIALKHENYILIIIIFIVHEMFSLKH